MREKEKEETLSRRIAISLARPLPSALPSDDRKVCRWPCRRGREGAGEAREWHWVYAGCRAPCLRIEPAAHAPHHSRPQARHALRATPVSCVAFPSRRNLSRLSLEGFARRPRGPRSELEGRRPRPPASRRDPRSPLAEGLVRTLGCGTLMTREGCATAPPIDRDR